MTSEVIASPQRVRWGPSDARPPGIRVWAESGTTEEFIPWEDLKNELERHLLPQLFVEPAGFRFETRDHHGKPNWLVQVFDQQNEWYCDVWFGNNPDEGWEFDGLIRLGDPIEEPHAWQTYERYSDGTYRRLPSLCADLDEFKRRRRQQE